MTRIVTRAGFGPDVFEGRIVSPEALLSGQDLPIVTPLALRLPVDAQAETFVPWFDKLDMVVLPFGSSADGRGFSLAARLRALGYAGRIRAEGHVLPDQFRAALAVGIDEIAISDEQAARTTEDQWLVVSHREGYRARLFAAE